MAGNFVGLIGLTNVGRFNSQEGLFPDGPGDDVAVPIIEVFGEDDQFDPGFADPAPLEVAVTTISGTASITEADDTLGSTAVLVIQATAAITEAGDTLSATATLKLQATAAITEADDTLSSTATLKIQATAAITEADDTVTSAATLKIQATAAITEAADTLSATATLKIQATASITEADDTLSATGGAQVFEASAPIITLFEEEDEQNLGFADPAPLDSAGAVATAAITEADDTLSSASTLKLQATAALTEQNDTGAETAVLIIQATCLMTEADDTLSATGGEQQFEAPAPIVTLYEEEDEPNLGYFDPAPLEVAGAASTNDIFLYQVPFFVNPNDIRLIDVTVAAPASVNIYLYQVPFFVDPNDVRLIDPTIAAGGISATVGITEANDTVASTGAFRLQATAAITEGDDAVSAAATLIIHAQAATGDADDTLAATSLLTIQGAVSSTEQDDVLVSTAGTVSATIAILDVTEGNDTLSSDAHNDTPVQQTGGAGSGSDGIRRRGVGRGRSLRDILDEIKTRHATAAIVEADDTLVATAQIVTLPVGLSTEDRHDQIAALIERTEALLEEEEAAILLLLAA